MPFRGSQLPVPLGAAGTVLTSRPTAPGGLDWETPGAGGTVELDAAYMTVTAGVYTSFRGVDGGVIATGTDPGIVENAAITYVNGLPNGGTSALPNGNIQLTATRFNMLSGVRLKGQGSMQQTRAGNGYGTTIIGPAGTDLTYIIDTVDATGAFINDLCVDGNNKTANGIRLAAYKATLQNVQCGNCVSINTWITAGAVNTFGAYFQMECFHLYIDGFSRAAARGVVIDGTLGTQNCTDGRIYDLDVFSTGDTGFDARKSDWQVYGGHVTYSIALTPTQGCNIASTGFLGVGMIVDSAIANYFQINAAGVRLIGCWAVYGGGADNTHNSVNVGGGAGVVISKFFVQLTGGSVPNWVIAQNGDPTGKARDVDTVVVIGVPALGTPASGMIDQPNEVDGYWVRGVYSHA